MNVEDIRGFLAVVDYGRVGAAADELGISQSALTRRVQRVEASPVSYTHLTLPTTPYV